MSLKGRIENLVKFGIGVQSFIDNDLGDKNRKDIGLVIEQAFLKNGWFTEKEVRRMLASIASWLKESSLSEWIKREQLNASQCIPSKVGVVMAGNIPMVGFHDLMCSYICGHKTIVKPSSKDAVLIPGLLKILGNQALNDAFVFDQGLWKDYDAVIATGSNNSARYFHQYFGHIPHIIRKNRRSVAVLTQDISPAALSKLAEDVFAYYGMGCRSVSHLFIPEGFDVQRIFEALFPYSSVLENKKYYNNYHYHKTIALMNNQKLLDNEFMCLMESDKLNAPIGCLYYTQYQSKKDLEKMLLQHQEDIQCIVGVDACDFGTSQSPKIWDYPDNINTISFLKKLNNETQG